MMPIVRLSNLICVLLLLGLLLQLGSLVVSLGLGDRSLAVGNGEMQLAIQPPDYSHKAIPVLQQLGYSLYWLSVPEQIFYLLLNIWLLRLFALYRRMVIFTEQNVHYFQCIGILLMIWACWKVLYTPLLVTVLGWLQHSRPLRYLEVQDSQLMLLVVGLIVWATGRVMAYGLALQQEQDLVI